MRPVLIMLSFVSVGVAAVLPALAQESSADGRRDGMPKVVGDVIDCQNLRTESERLACFDRTVAALEASHRKRDILIADREQLRETRRGLFGLNVPAARILTDTQAGDDDKAAGKDRGGATPEAADEALDQIEAVIQSARQSGGKWVFVIDDGAVWRQVDDRILYGEPVAGKSRIVIQRAALGSFMAKVDGQRAMRVKRIVE